MNFIEGRIDIEPGQLRQLSELLADLNQACRTTFSRSIRDKLPPKVMTEPWAKKAGCFEGQVGLSLMLTSHQAGMVVRQAKSLRKTANARAKWLSEHHTKLAEACSGKLGKVSAEISKLEAPLANPAPWPSLGFEKSRWSWSPRRGRRPKARRAARDAFWQVLWSIKSLPTWA